MSSFSLATYQPVACHAYPELMRARRAAPPAPADAALPGARGAAREVQGGSSLLVQHETVRRSAAPQPVTAATELLVTVLSVGSTDQLRTGLSAFLDGAGRRRDVRVSVGVVGAPGVAWVLREAVPYDVRALPQYPPDDVTAYDSALPVAPPGAEPDGHRLLVVVWGTEPRPITWTGTQRPHLVVHCLDWVVDPAHLPMAAPGAEMVLSRTVPGVRPSLLGHCGRLLTSWAAFQDVPRGLVLTTLDRARGTTP